MSPKIWWAISVLLLALLVLFTLLGLIDLLTAKVDTMPIPFVDALPLFGLLIFGGITIALFVINNRAGIYLTYTYSVYFIVVNLIAVCLTWELLNKPLLGRTDAFLPNLVSNNLNSFSLFYSSFSLLWLAIGIILLISAWKSKPLFKENKPDKTIK